MLQRLGRLEEALEVCARAIELDPTYTYAYQNKSSVLQELGRLEEALLAFEQVPARIVQFVAMQLNVHPEALADYGVRRPQTCDEHFVQIRSHLKLRPYTHAQDQPRLTAYLLTRALQRDDPAVLLEEAEEWLREEGMLFPAEGAIQKIITQVRLQAEQHVFAAITRQLSAPGERSGTPVADYLCPYQPAWVAPLRLASTGKDNYAL